MNAEQLNIDDFVDYAAEYKSIIKNANIAGDKLTGLCPFHDDRSNSFSVDLKTGMWYCFAEDEGGNFITFYSKYYGLNTKDAYKEILNKYGRLDNQPQPKPEKPKLQPFTLQEYSFAKKLPEDFLKEVCRVSTGKDRDGTKWLKMPYFKENGEAEIFRKRYGNKEFRWSYGSSGKLCLYGGWRLPEIRQNAIAFLLRARAIHRHCGTCSSQRLEHREPSTLKTEWCHSLKDSSCISTRSRTRAVRLFLKRHAGF